MALESYIGILLVIIIIIGIATLALIYFVYKIIKKNKQLIDQEQPGAIKAAKQFLKK